MPQSSRDNNEDDRFSIHWENHPDFFEKEGAIGLIIVLRQGEPKQYKEINEKLHISETTLDCRLKEALEIGLIELAHRKSDGKSGYRNTVAGSTVWSMLYEFGLYEKYSLFVEVHKDYNETRDNFRDSISLEKLQARLDYLRWSYGEDAKRNEQEYIKREYGVDVGPQEHIPVFDLGLDSHEPDPQNDDDEE